MPVAAAGCEEEQVPTTTRNLDRPGPRLGPGPALPALLAGTLIGGVCAVWTQSSSTADVIAAAHTGYVSATGVAEVDDLLTRGGLMGMMETVALIICALCFGGIMERSGMLEEEQ